MEGTPSLDRRSLFRTAAGVGALAVAGQLITPGSASAAPAAPRVHSCAEWGARAVSGITTLNKKPNRILVHHMASPNSTNYTQAHAFQVARNCQAGHMGQGWADTGQHFTISRGGFVMEGRKGSLATLKGRKQMIKAAHCPGFNENSIGIENEGTYTSAVPTTAQWNALVNLCAYVCYQYGISPSNISGHRDHFATACPGNQFYAKLAQLRTAVKAKL
ncbi:peptidoglycan recognition family protein [Allokutzneria sp. NRRL B-24872]|uniref:peptidoglycan recognition protein family protein n=1 Tax=Allokutzneria sp. NRRL B-24872 TaxID=1137961 RepID=UPI000A3B71FC|nr:peptidoglycan recognition family protein [Allokutzneria sp. NRRL B-24872]